VDRPRGPLGKVGYETGGVNEPYGETEGDRQMIQLKTIIVPTDFSDPSEEAVCYAGALAEKHGARVLLLHVLESDTLNAVRTFDAGGELIEKLTADRESYLKRLAKLDALSGIEVEHRLLEGVPAYEIVEAARDRGADLIIMGTHGLTGAGRVFFGSVAERVVRMASMPVLTVRRPGHGFVECAVGARRIAGMKRILLPTDFSVASAYAAQWAVALAREYQAQLHVLHVLPEGFTLLKERAARSRMTKEAEASLDAFLKDETKGLEVSREVKTGEPFQEIVTEARGKATDVVVMGTHGRTFLKYAVLGSVASKVVRKAPCPVLTVRHPKHEFEMP
jgi:nucleotide-binding universal stress UspA family protein